MGDGCAIRHVPILSCQSAEGKEGVIRRLWRPCAARFPGCWEPTLYAGCGHNELRALAMRVLSANEPFTQPTAAGRNRFRLAIKILKGKLASIGWRMEPMSIVDFLETYKGSKRITYERAAENYRQSGFKRGHFDVKAFVKKEKAQFIGKDPRLIQACDPIGNVAFGRYTKPVEKLAYGLKSGYRWGVAPSPLIAKGFSQRKRAEVIMQKWGQFDSPVCVMLDASRFDKHVREYQLRAIHGIYHMLFGSGEIQRICAFQLACKGRTRSGIKYSLGPQRKSGDMDTSLGNCLIMSAMVIAWCKHSRLSRFDLFDDGDDCLVFMERRELDGALALLANSFASMGHNVTLEGVAHRLADIVHCQSIFLGGEHPIMTRRYEKVLSHGLCSIRHFFSKRGGQRILKAMAYCESVLGSGVPIVWKFAEIMRKSVSGVRATMLLTEELEISRRAALEIDLAKISKLAMPAAPSDATRQAFYDATGVSPGMQRVYEARLETDCKFDLAFEFEPLGQMRLRNGGTLEAPSYIDFLGCG